jgi:hypothetical protein
MPLPARLFAFHGLRRCDPVVRSSMKKRSLTSDGKMIEHARGLGTVTAEMVSQRAHEIAEINGRSDNKPTPGDWSQARNELTRNPDAGGDATAELPVDKRWDPVPGPRGTKANNLAADDEQTLAEKLVDQGVEEAEHEHMVEGTRESVRRDRDTGDSAGEA